MGGNEMTPPAGGTLTTSRPDGLVMTTWRGVDASAVGLRAIDPTVRLPSQVKVSAGDASPRLAIHGRPDFVIKLSGSNRGRLPSVEVPDTFTKEVGAGKRASRAFPGNGVAVPSRRYRRGFGDREAPDHLRVLVLRRAQGEVGVGHRRAEGVDDILGAAGGKRRRLVGRRTQSGVKRHSRDGDARQPSPEGNILQGQRDSRPYVSESDAQPRTRSSRHRDRVNTSRHTAPHRPVVPSRS